MGFYAVILNAYKERGRPTKIHDSVILLHMNFAFKRFGRKDPKILNRVCKMYEYF